MTNKLRWFNVVGRSTRSVWFHKRLNHLCDLAFFVADTNQAQLRHDRFEFWQPASKLLALDVCLFDAFA
ncbi:TPA: DUF645 family protein [Vibrio cholerae]|nr:DUF645 family protein [Vibrio cholerae]EGR5575395.1 DUF645 family protein [Vibrio cholerae]EGX7709470.1 DUF645 family protein [Vibrio cholerae]EJL6510790.1 DUF645 family protein [Vibrio cholerae]EJL9424601.1 DUF645 family protein [Vibrio cholerae]